MRNEALIGYLLHQRPYQEKRALYYLFSQQHGVIHGIGKKGAPLFMPLQLFATGKRDLKTFSQINIASLSFVQKPIEQEDSNAIGNSDPIKDSSAIMSEVLHHDSITGQHQYAALYLNEILWRLLPTEDPMPVLWHHYQDSLRQLKQPLTADELRLCLRHFETYLFNELGFSLTLKHDSLENPIEPHCAYRFLADVGLVPIVHTEDNDRAITHTVFSGREILMMLEQGISAITLNAWSRLHRQLIDHLLDYQPLQSRLLWQQQQRYQS
ncbi:DNA repair protein RecO [Psychrobacter sp. DAB_AL62B]|uniref:DNA repair protein RecO n=1 Tax=Psychrobacter sp. DAB_AL62B TaxID=1028420 RepID=UPI002380CD49|nr:DNA repair protein RecO C-terminal domain-containing protein [Psychrobacter sp. DAB_AL62B]MDE4454593.1 DNA recombination protein RecO [Psychrobacter sp. DAB_AL62B]